ncbi:MAG: hypothetical protein SPE03_06340 [Treponema sp.]|nr:hypothetical protein [Treponema sp.]
MTILQHEPAAAPKKVFLPCVSLPLANFSVNIFIMRLPCVAKEEKISLKKNFPSKLVGKSVIFVV